MHAKMEHKLIRILISKEEDMFVAQCLEHDIAVQAHVSTAEQNQASVAV